MKLEKIAISGDEAAVKLLGGLRTLARVVGVTYGPQGRLVLLEVPWSAPIATRDGVTVTKAVELADPLEALGAQLLRHAALRTADIAGDGTTTAVLLGYGMVAEATRAIAAGAHRAQLAEELVDAVAVAVAGLQAARLEATPERLLRVAALAARDEEIGKKIVAAWHAAGSGGEVEIERGRGRSGTTAVSYGHSFETAGYHADLGPLDNGGAKLNNAAVIAGDRLEDAAATSRLLDEALPRPMFVVGRIGEAVRDRLLATRHAGRPVVAAFPPGKGGGHGDALHSFFGDIATLTGGEVYRGRGVLTPGSASLDFDRRRVMLTQPAGDADQVDALRRRLREEIVGESSAHARTVVRHRLAFLARPLVRIEVGAPTLPEAEEVLHRYEDALGSVRGAGEDGVLPGGGAALRAVAPMLPATPGGQVLARALGYPLRRLLVNAGVEPGPVIIALDEAGPGFTWDLRRERPALADEIGVLDSAGAVRSALVHAADVAQAIILTDTVLAEREMFWR